MNEQSSSRRRIYHLLIAVVVGMAVSHIVSAKNLYDPLVLSSPEVKPPVWPKARPREVPTFGANDRSRWATVRALVDHGTYVFGKRDRLMILCSAVAPVGVSPLEAAVLAEAGHFARISEGPKLLEGPPNVGNYGIIFEDGWKTHDRVLHDKRLEFYSSKPPLLPTLMAGLYWLLKWLTGWTLNDNYFEVVRTLTLVIHPLPFAVYLLLLGRLVERHGNTDWGRFYVMIAGCFATLVTPFLTSFNNHTPGTFSVMFVLYSLMTIWDRQKPVEDSANLRALSRKRHVWQHYVLAGFFAGFAVTCELPALALACAVGGLLLLWSPVKTLCLYVPAAALPLAGLLFTNYLAIGKIWPAYGEFGGPPPYQRDFNVENEKLSPWYQYEGSHWLRTPGERRHTIDWARYYENRNVYAMNLLVGHHGLFSLSPIWILAVGAIVVGLGRMAWRLHGKRAPPHPTGETPTNSLPWFVPVLTLLVSVVVIGFYLMISDSYGGVSVGPRWLMWLSPLLLLCLLPAADWLGKCRWGRALGIIFLAVSAFSASYPGWSPWRHPWLFDLERYLDWVRY